MREHIADFWAYNDLLDKATVPNPNRHFNYRRNEGDLNVVKLPDMAKHVDYDTLITIAPEKVSRAEGVDRNPDTFPCQNNLIRPEQFFTAIRESIYE